MIWDVEKVWTFDFNTMVISESQTLFETPHLFADFIFQVSGLLIKYLIYFNKQIGHFYT